MADYSDECLSQMKADDKMVQYYSLDIKEVSSGCTGTKMNTLKGKGFFAITEQRLIFKGSSITQEGNSASSETVTMNIPLAKISSVTCSKKKIATSGCGSSTTTYYAIIVNVQGAIYSLYGGNNDSMGKEIVRSFLETTE